MLIVLWFNRSRVMTQKLISYARNVTRLILMQMNKLSFKKSVSNKNYHALFLSELIVYKGKCIVYHYGTSMHQFDYLAESNRQPLHVSPMFKNSKELK